MVQSIRTQNWQIDLMPITDVAGVFSPRRDIAIACLLASAVGLLGLLPHLIFCNEIGAVQYFHGAYDEDSYILSWLRGTLRSTRALSGSALSVLHAASAHSVDTTLIASDFVFPFVATCAAYFAVAQILSKPSSKTLGTLFLVFAGDFFSLGDLSVWSSSYLNIVAFSRLVHLFAPNLVPAYETHFLSIFRTPEPQVSFTLMFVILGLLVRLAKSERVTLGLGVLMSISAAVLPLGYTFITAPIAALVAGMTVVLALDHRKRAAAVTAISLICAIGVGLSAHFFERAEGQTTENLAGALSYASRMPIVTPATIGSLVLSIAYAVWLVRQRRREPLALLALGCLLLPFVLSNQQIISGIMISARDWERNVSYPLLVFSAVAAASLTIPSFETKLSSKVASVLCLCCLVILLRAQWITFRTWEPTNIRSIAIVRALKSVDPVLLAKAQLTFEDVGSAQLVQVRMRDSIDVPLSFYKVATGLVPNMAAAATIAAPSPYENLVFEQWARIGVTAMDAEALLRMEVQQRAGTFTSYLFSVRDAWYPASDRRADRSLELERSVPLIIERYAKFLLSARSNKVFSRPTLLIAFKPSAQLSHFSWLKDDLVASATVRGLSAYVYRQSAAVE